MKLVDMLVTSISPLRIGYSVCNPLQLMRSDSIANLGCFITDDNMIARSSMNTDSTTIDENAALAALNGDRQLLCELAQIFVEDVPTLLSEVDAALAADQVDVARRLVHSLRGLSSTFFASPTTEIAKRMEEAASKGQLEVLRDGGVEQLKVAFQELAGQLRNVGLAR